MSEKHDAFSSWVEQYEARKQPETTLMLRRMQGPPIWALRTVKEPVEPIHSAWARLEAILEAISEGFDDEAFYEATPEHLDLIRLEHDMRKQAFRDVPNLEYDEVRATEYWESRSVIQIGQSYNPEAK